MRFRHLSATDGTSEISRNTFLSLYFTARVVQSLISRLKKLKFWQAKKLNCYHQKQVYLVLQILLCKIEITLVK